LGQQKCETFISIPYIYIYTPLTFILFCHILICFGNHSSITAEKHKFLHNLKIQELIVKLVNDMVMEDFNKKGYILIT
jgi:hypothetical protein